MPTAIDYLTDLKQSIQNNRGQLIHWLGSWRSTRARLFDVSADTKAKAAEIGEKDGVSIVALEKIAGTLDAAADAIKAGVMTSDERAAADKEDAEIRARAAKEKEQAEEGAAVAGFLKQWRAARAAGQKG